jgi:hypothetical protein
MQLLVTLVVNVHTRLVASFLRRTAATPTASM